MNDNTNNHKLTYEIRPSVPALESDSVIIDDISKEKHQRRPSLQASSSRRPSCLKTETNSETRNIYINDEEQNNKQKFASNKLRSTKYTPINLIPKALLEQFRRVSNFYFLFVAVVSFIPHVSPYSPWASVAPLFVVVGFGFARDVYEDIQRSLEDSRQNSQQHIILNSQNHNHSTAPQTKKHELTLNQPHIDIVQRNHLNIDIHHSVQSKNIHVGDIVLVQKGHIFPCDLLLIHASSDDNVAYVSTANLDGESSLKRVIVAKSYASQNNHGLSSSNTTTPEHLSSLQGVIHAQKPVPALHEFSGSMTIHSTMTDKLNEQNTTSESIPLSVDNLLLRGSILRNTEYIYGIAVYTGRDTKVAINMKKPVSKLGTIELMLNRVVLTMFIVLLIIIIISSILSGVLQYLHGPDQWYMDELKFFSGVNAGVRGLGTFLILFSTFIPSSLFVTLEFVRVVQALFIIADTRMKTSRPNDNEIEGGGSVVARSMNLNETLGEVEHILTDKTGTLTENDMRFVACSVNNEIYNILENKSAIHDAVEKNSNKSLKQLLLGMAICHSVVVEPMNNNNSNNNNSNDNVNNDEHENQDPNQNDDEHDDLNKRGLKSWKGKLQKHKHKSNDSDSNRSSMDKNLPEYQGQSPDEVALVTSARKYGVELLDRTIESIVLNRFGNEEKYKLLAELEFNSDRKRMSIIVRCPDGKIRLFCKGADNIMLTLVNNSSSERNRIESDINEFAKLGLRTLVYAVKIIDDQFFNQWFKNYQKALNLIDGREETKNALSSQIEVDLQYVATTAVEDKLQAMVPETIKFLREAGIRIWVLTGDKRETAENIGYSANLLDVSMQVVHISGTSSKDVKNQLTSAQDQFSTFSGKSLLKGKHRRTSSLRDSFSRKLSSLGAAPSERIEKDEEQDVGIIIDGISLQFAVEDHSKLFMELSDLCKVVICCRVTPLQKALCVRLVRTSRKVITLAVGDGGNDVSMIQEAHIGVGIFGKEGTQAARSADYAIGEFKHLLRLTVLHGRYSGVRTAGLINLSFYKNVFFTMTQVLFQFFNFWSGQTFHDQWLAAAFNVLITSASPFLYGIFERDLDESTVTRFPSIYKQNKKKQALSLTTIGEYTLIYGMWHSLVVFFGTFGLFGHFKIVFTDGLDHGLFLVGVVASTLAVFMTYFKFLLHSYTWNWVVLLGILLSLVVFFALFPLCVSVLEDYSLEGQLEMVVRSPTFWLGTFVIITASYLVDFLFLLYRKSFKPSLVERLQVWEQRPENRHSKHK